MTMPVTGEVEIRWLLTRWYFWVLVALAIYSLTQPPTYIGARWSNMVIGPVTSLSALAALLLGIIKWLWVLVGEIRRELDSLFPTQVSFWKRWFEGRWSPVFMATDSAATFALIIWVTIQGSMGIGWVFENFF